MNTSQPIADIVSLCIFIAALMFSSEVASVIGPYMVMVVAGAIGGSFALARRETSTRLDAVWFFVRVVGLAVLLTAGVATGISIWKPELKPSVTVAPIALLIGYVDWQSLLAKLVRVGFAALDMVRGKGGQS